MGDAMTLRLTVVCPYVPYPPDHGGKAEVWGRLQGMARLGAPAQLLCWSDHSLAADTLRTMEQTCVDVLVLQPRPILSALLAFRDPPRARRLMPSGSARARIISRVREFSPDLLLLEGWTAYRCADDLRQQTRTPLVYRSQNVEVDYWRAMFEASRGYTRIRLGPNTRRIARFERLVRLSADLVLDISNADRLRSKELAQEGNALVLPGTRLPIEVNCLNWSSRDIDVLFAGNLWAPNNVSGLVWFADHVMPLLARRRPSVRVVFAGSRPSAAVRYAAARCGIQVIANPPDLAALRSRARVLMNPQVQYGGLMQKMLDYLAHGSWIVSTTIGAAGLTGRLPGVVILRDEDATFAEALIACLEREPQEPKSAPLYLDAEFGESRLVRSLDEIATALSIGPPEEVPDENRD